jgi:NAD(P)-dependent dehydrogenase (short-subunit alcohol dehydrogenase family)
MSNTSRNALVLGASGGLGQAVVAKFLTDPKIDNVIAVSRNPQTEDLSAQWISNSRLIWIEIEDYTEQAMTEVVAQLDDYKGRLCRIAICHGLLHTDHIWPEKRMEDIDGAAMQEIFRANVVVPATWLKLLQKVIAGKLQCRIAVFSARVGSTGDNRLGGWYSYRASKAALNSMLKSFSIEYGRRAKNVKIIAFHPGTTDTDLSKPFQASVPKEQLFAPAFVAEQLVAIMDGLEMDGQLSFLDWNNKPIAW